MGDHARPPQAAIGGPLRRLAMPRAIPLWLGAILLPSEAMSGAFDESEYRVPVLQECTDHANVSLGSACGWVWGEGELILADDSSIDWIVVHEVKVGAVFRQDLGNARLALGATLADQYSLVTWDNYYSQTLRVDEAYAKLGYGEWVFSVGRQDSIANFYDDERLTDFLLYGQITAQTGIGYSFSQLVGGNGVQTFYGGPWGWSGGVSVEALGEAAWSTVRVTQPDPTGTLVGVVNYASEGITAHSTLLVTGLLDDKSRKVLTHSGATATLGVFSAVGAVATEYDDTSGIRYDEWLTSVAIDLSSIQLAASIYESFWDDRQYDATVEWEIAPWLTFGAGREWYVNDSEFQRFTGAWLQIAPLENLELAAGYYVGEDSYGGFDFALATVDWMPTNTSRLSGRGTWTEYGDYKIEFSAKQRVN